MAPIRQQAWRLSGIALLALALIAVFTLKGGREVDRSSPAASPGRIAEGSNGISDRPEEPPVKATKVDRIRPTREELERKNSEQRRVELAAGLQKLKAGGLGAQHPAMKAITDQISKDPDIRIQPAEKNTVILWTRNQGTEGSSLTRYRFSDDGSVSLKTVHRLDAMGNPQSARIYNGQNEELYKISYGYRKADGKLMEERVFDSNARQLDDNGAELPARRIIYHDAPDDDVVRVIDPSPLPISPEEMKFQNPFVNP